MSKPKPYTLKIEVTHTSKRWYLSNELHGSQANSSNLKIEAVGFSKALEPIYQTTQYYTTLKIKAAHSSERLVPIHRIARPHIPEGLNQGITVGYMFVGLFVVTAFSVRQDC
jgi:hypothetical protein